MTARRLVAAPLALLLLAIAAMSAPAALASTFVVNATDDTSDPCGATHCTLRAAINLANTVSGSTISFNLPETSSLHCVSRTCFTVYSTNPIVLTSPLPVITSPVTIDGTTQPHFFGPPMVEVRGGVSSGLKLGPGSDHSIIKSLSITSFGIGVVVASSNNGLSGNRIGVDMNGVARPNSIGIAIEGDFNQIGGSSSNGEGNLISGNNSDGLVFCDNLCGRVTPASGLSASNNFVAGNLIGTDPSGTTAMGNQNGIVVAGSGVHGNVVGGGGQYTDFHNVVSGNHLSGILVESASGTLIGGNLVGLNASGTAAVPNASSGISLQDASSTTVGNFGLVTKTCTVLGRPVQCAETSGGPNTISGNTGDGIHVNSTLNTHDVLILGNNIGTDPSGANPLANSGNGISTIGVNNTKNTRIGDSGTGNANLIAFNHLAGVAAGVTSDGSSEAPLIRFNSIFSNGGLGIDEGVPANSGGGPFVTSAVSSSSGTTVKGNVNRGAFSGSFTTVIDFYTNTTCDPSGFGEGATYVTSASVTSPSVVDNSFTLTLPSLPPGSVLTATENGTASSMFSQCVTVN